MLRTLKLRVLYLELWRRGGQSAIEEQQRLLDDMVPKGKPLDALDALDALARVTWSIEHSMQKTGPRGVLRCCGVAVL